MSVVIAGERICVIDDGITDEEHTKILKLLTGSLWRYGWPYPYHLLIVPAGTALLQVLAETSLKIAS